MKNYYEGKSSTGAVDFIITWDATEKEYLVDFFDSKNSDNETAYIETLSYTTFHQALASANSYIQF